MSHKRLALVVDDDPDIALVCTLHLEGAGFEVIEAGNGQLALDLAAVKHPHVIVLDYMLPDLDGVEVLRRLKAEPATAAIPVLMLTARTHKKDQAAAWEAGAHDFMVKPFDGKEFVEAVSRAAEEGEGDTAQRRDEAIGQIVDARRAVDATLAAVVREATDAVICKDLDGTITFWNHGAEELYGWTAEEAVGQSIRMVAAPETVEEIDEILDRLSAGERVTLHETTRLHRDGRRLHISLSVTPIHDDLGRVVGGAAIARDVTDRVRRETRYEGLIEAAPDAMILLNEQGEIEMVNQQAELMFGYDRFRLLGRKVEMLVPERFRGQHPVFRRQYAENPRTRSMGAGLDLYALRSDGSEFPVEISLSPLEEREHGRTYAAAIRDVTERRTTEARFRGLLDAAPDAMVAVDQAGLITLVNRQAEKLFGYAREELLGEPVELLVPLGSRGAHPVLREGYLRGGGGHRTFGLRPELSARRKDGTAFPAEISLSSLQTPEGVIVCAAIRDITARKLADNRFRGVIESAPDAMVIVSDTGAIELVNGQVMRLFGYEREELIGQPIEVLMPLRYRGRHPEHRRRFVRSPRLRPMGANLQLSALRKDGTEFPVEISLSPIEADGTVSVCATIRDVTARRQIEQSQRLAAEREREASARLREVDRLRTDFLATVSHELRTPLTAIKGFAEWLVGSWDVTEESRKRDMVQRIHHAGGRLDFLIQDLLDFSRLERGKLKVELETQVLGELLEEALRNTATALEDHHVDNRVDADLEVVVDRSAFLRVLENLLTNAAKFSPRGSAIHLDVDVAPETVVLSVRDEGVGIPEEEHEKVFDRFYRSPATATSAPGTGIGLAIVKHFVEAQGGSVELRSGPDEGCDFRVTIRRVLPGS
ncbi:PAS domain S-box protein [Nocardioides marmoribigeumensis]|uniref:histidine kinase n=1 Tax=Nocardioides marmoribigeumensis TaxID=433649 RepID=A0ABU2BVM7_9ACTN|nr:PAS domain S-box protein [Nocardioides marmoribigeumensis]MDR7362680.1 protein-histidine pros-kinase [Nocardioides marmoribigeumensis]